MKILISTLTLLIPIFTYAEYTGVHVKFQITFKDSTSFIGYKFIPHGSNSIDYKEQLEINPESLLLDKFTYESGEYGCYSGRLAYPYEESFVYKLINPVDIDTHAIQEVKILDLVIASYAVQIIGDYYSSDQAWMDSKPINRYSSYDEMCIYDIFIHKNDSISREIELALEQVIKEYDAKITENELEWNTINNDDDFYQEKIKEIQEERNTKILEIINNNEELKTVIVSTCTC